MSSPRQPIGAPSPYPFLVAVRASVLHPNNARPIGATRRHTRVGPAPDQQEPVTETGLSLVCTCERRPTWSSKAKQLETRGEHSWSPPLFRRLANGASGSPGISPRCSNAIRNTRLRIQSAYDPSTVKSPKPATLRAFCCALGTSTRPATPKKLKSRDRIQAPPRMYL